FPEEVHLHPRPRGRGARSFLSDFRDLRVGDLVVHEEHGIGRFEGLETLEVGGARREFMVLVYQGGDKLKVPVEAFDRVQKYASAEGARPVIDRKQVAVLAPTTVLAFQHWKTFRKRFAPFPVTVEMVSRFRPPREIKQVLADTATGRVDILVGTHRLLSRDVAFRDLGLLVV